MSWMTILTLVAALAFGIWIGLPRRFEQSPEEIDQLLGKKGEHQKVKRHPTFLNMLQRRTQKGSSRRRSSRSRRPFQM